MEHSSSGKTTALQAANASPILVCSSKKIKAVNLLLNSLEPICFDLPDAPATIYPIGDLHFGSEQFMQRRWELFLEKVKSEPNSYVILVGDLIDNGVKSSVTNCYEETYRPCEQKRLVAKYLEPIKDKILCAVQGNHEARSGKDADDDPVYDIMAKLDLEDRYRPDAAFLMLHLNGKAGDTTCGDYRPTYTFCVTHGAGGGQYIGSSANKGERFGMAFDGLDCLIYGHVHKPVEFPVAKFRIDTNHKNITRQQFRVVVCSSWLDYGGYPIRKMLMPTAVCDQQIVLSNRGKNIQVTM